MNLNFYLRRRLQRNIQSANQHENRFLIVGQRISSLVYPASRWRPILFTLLLSFDNGQHFGHVDAISLTHQYNIHTFRPYYSVGCRTRVKQYLYQLFNVEIKPFSIFSANLKCKNAKLCFPSVPAGSIMQRTCPSRFYKGN